MRAHIDSLTQALQNIIPQASLQITPLPDCPQIQLLLLNADYPQDSLQPEQVQRAMNNPLYWVFCWASGQALANFLLRDPSWVAGKRVLDFGCGSGVVAIAAAMAGAANVIACDSDPLALRAMQLNAQLNNVTLELASDFNAIDGEIDIIIAADVLYDRRNFPWLERFAERAEQVLIADSRITDFDIPPYGLIARQQSCTLPDLDESVEFRDVRIYLAD